MPSGQLAKNTYQKLLDEIAGIYDRALKDARLAFKRGIIDAYRVLESRNPVKKNTNSVRLDCGFGVMRTFRLLSPALAELWPPTASLASGGRTPDPLDLAMMN